MTDDAKASLVIGAAALVAAVLYFRGKQSSPVVVVKHVVTRGKITKNPFVPTHRPAPPALTPVNPISTNPTPRQPVTQRTGGTTPVNPNNGGLTIGPGGKWQPTETVQPVETITNTPIKTPPYIPVQSFQTNHWKSVFPSVQNSVVPPFIRFTGSNEGIVKIGSLTVVTSSVPEMANPRIDPNKYRYVSASVPEGKVKIGSLVTISSTPNITASVATSSAPVTSRKMLSLSTSSVPQGKVIIGSAVVVNSTPVNSTATNSNTIVSVTVFHSAIELSNTSSPETSVGVKIGSLVVVSTRSVTNSNTKSVTPSGGGSLVTVSGGNDGGGGGATESE